MPRADDIPYILTLFVCYLYWGLWAGMRYPQLSRALAVAEITRDEPSPS